MSERAGLLPQTISLKGGRQPKKKTGTHTQRERKSEREMERERERERERHFAAEWPKKMVLQSWE
jgi:hypothetical protein